MLFIWIYDPSVIFLTNSSPAVIWYQGYMAPSKTNHIITQLCAGSHPLSLSAAFTVGAYQPVLIPELSFQNKVLPTVQTTHA